MKTDYFKLPDGMEVDEVAHYFDEFFDLYEHDHEGTYYLHELWQLAERQWHTYEIIDDKRKERVEKFLLDTTDYTSLQKVEAEVTLSIVLMLGLQRVYDVILDQRKNIVNPEILEEINSCVNEYGLDIRDPYARLRSQISQSVVEE